MLKRVAAVLTLLHVVPAAAQTTEDAQFWLNVTAMGRVSENGPLYFMEIQPRLSGGAKTEAVLLRGAIGLQATPRLSIYQGYSRILLPVEGPGDRGENRSFQQVMWNAGRVGPFDFSTRTRFEQRWLSDGDDMGLRFRNMLRFRLPLRRDRTGIGLLGWSETFVALNDTDWGARKGFDQQRTFAGFELPAGGRSTVEAGYLNHYVDQGNGAARMNHVASLTVFIRQ